MIGVTSDVVQEAIWELVQDLASDKAEAAARYLSEFGDYELVSKGAAKEDILVLAQLLLYLARDIDEVENGDDFLRARVVELRDKTSTLRSIVS